MLSMGLRLLTWWVFGVRVAPLLLSLRAGPRHWRGAAASALELPDVQSAVATGGEEQSAA